MKKVSDAFVDFALDSHGQGGDELLASGLPGLGHRQDGWDDDGRDVGQGVQPVCRDWEATIPKSMVKYVPVSWMAQGAVQAAEIAGLGYTGNRILVGVGHKGTGVAVHPLDFRRGELVLLHQAVEAVDGAVEEAAAGIGLVVVAGEKPLLPQLVQRLQQRGRLPPHGGGAEGPVPNLCRHRAPR